ncbi:MAG: DUF4179 domain-containing protein [Bacillota bacterium]
MNCTVAQASLLDYRAESLDQGTRQELEAHLAECPVCRAELERWRSVERWVGQGIGKMVAGQSPERPAAQILRSVADLTRNRQRRALAMIAAAVAVMLILSPLFVPLSARVLASTPLVGGYFATAIAESGLAVDYQAGLVTELNQSVTDGQLTLTVMGAYADATQTTVLFTISGEQERMKQLWDDLSGTREQVSLRDSLGREYTGHSSRSGHFDQATGQYHIVMETNALPFYVGHLKLHMQMLGQTVSADWKISFPVQRVSDRLVKELQVNRSFTTTDGVPVTIAKLVFSPSRTVLHYSMQQPDAPDFGLPQWSLIADGQILTPLGGGGGSRGEGFTGTAAFFPTSAKELAIRYEGLMGSYPLNWRLAMQPGASTRWHEIIFTIDEVKSGNGETRVRASMKGGFIKFDPVLQQHDGTIINGKVMDFKPSATEDGGVFEMVFSASSDLTQATMTIDRGHGLLPDPWSITITRP